MLCQASTLAATQRMPDRTFRMFTFKPLTMSLTLLVLLLLVAEVGLPILLYLMRNRLIFLPSAQPSPEVGLQLLHGSAKLELLHIARPDGRLLATYDVHPIIEQDSEGPLIIFFHGNAGNIGMRAPLIEEFVRQTGVRTILPDYSGYGGNHGTPTEQEVYRDGLAIYDHLEAQAIAPHRIVLYGESLGAAVALFVATQRPSAGLILQSPFASISSIARRLFPWMPLSSVLTRRTFPSVERIGELEIPILIVHGRRDREVPISEGRKLHRAAHREAEFVVIEDAGHNDLFEVGGRDYFQLIAERVRQWTSTPAPLPMQTGDSSDS